MDDDPRKKLRNAIAYAGRTTSLCADRSQAVFVELSETGLPQAGSVAIAQWISGGVVPSLSEIRALGWTDPELRCAARAVERVTKRQKRHDQRPSDELLRRIAEQSRRVVNTFNQLDLAVSRERVAQLGDAVRQLKPKYRGPMENVDLREKPSKPFAEERKLKTNTVKSQLDRGRAQLAKRLADEDPQRRPVVEVKTKTQPGGKVPGRAGKG